MRHFWSQIQGFLFLHKNWCFNKFEGTGLKYNNNFFKFQSKITQKRHFGSKFQDFHSCMKLCVLTTSRVLISNMVIVFLTYSPKIGLQCKVFLFYKKHCILRISRQLVSKISIVFLKFQS